MNSPGLSYRQPETRWMIISAIAALCLHGFCWFVTRLLWGDPNAVEETQRQMTLALTWMVCVLVMWKISLPPSRLHATLGVLMYALFVVTLGTAAALIKLVFVDGYGWGAELLKTFSMVGIMLFLTQMSLAVPSAILLQALALKRMPQAQ